jgi:peptide/nickel transport system substrate-binding protein
MHLARLEVHQEEELVFDRSSRRRLDQYRRSEGGEIENAIVDEYLGGAVDRREFIRRASVAGISAPVVGLVLSACGSSTRTASKHSATAATARLRLAVSPAPSSGLEPSVNPDLGAIATMSISGEYLVRGAQSAALEPELALSWKPNADASVWTFKLRPNVKFQTGQTMTADDVVTTWKRLAAPGSDALSAIGSYLDPAGVEKVDELTVAFHLTQPIGNFPSLVSSYTPGAIILPASYKLGTYAKAPQTTGAFKISAYTPGVSASFDRFAGWWGGSPPLAGVDVTYYSSSSAADASLLAHEVDLEHYATVIADRTVIDNAAVQVIAAEGALHTEVPMRVDDHNALADYRVRQAIALTLDRPSMIQTFFNGRAQLGNDSPFAPSFGLARSVPQRTQDIEQAKSLMAAAGYAGGFPVTLTAQQFGEIPDLAQVIQQSVKAIGIDLKVNLVTEAADYAGTPSGPPDGWGNTPWLNAPMSATPWGGRPVPNVYLVAAFATLSKSGAGIWNGAHYSNPAFDAAVKSFLAATTSADENKYATQMQTILLHDTPVLIPYFYDWLAAASPNVKGYKADTQGGVYLSRTALS